MTNFYFFGDYKNYYRRIDHSQTEDRRSTKWRSAEPVPENAVPFNDGEYWFMGNRVHLVYLTDIEYQLRNTEPVHWSRWITYAEDSRDYSDFDHRGRDFYIRFNIAERQDVQLDSTNPNSDRFLPPVPTPKQLPPPQFIAFAEVRLELGYDYGVVGGHEFKTEIIEVADDREQRNALRTLPLGRWQLGDRNLLDSEADSIKEVSDLKQFHLERKGSYEGFRFKDWADYQGKNELIGVGDGVKNRFQLRKAYRAGDAVTYRPIQKPVEATVELFIDDVSITPQSIDHATGIVEFAEPLGEGVELTANFEFDVPVWFESDSIPITLEYYNPNTNESMYRLGNVFVAERRLPLDASLLLVYQTQDINEELDLGIIYDTVETLEINNNKLALNSGFIKSEAKREDQRLLFDLGANKLNSDELDLLLGYFWNAKGKCKEWGFRNKNDSYVVRFNTDKLNLNFEASNQKDILFSLSGLKLAIKERAILKIPSLPDFFVNIINFEISDFAITKNNQSISSNSFLSYGGGLNSAALENANKANKSSGFVGSFGYSFVEFGSIENQYELIVVSINFIDSIPVLSMSNFLSERLSKGTYYPLVGLPEQISDGRIYFSIKDPFSANPNSASNIRAYPGDYGAGDSHLINIDDILITGAGDKFSNDFWSYAISHSDTFSFTSNIEPDNKTNSVAREFYYHNKGVLKITDGQNSRFNSFYLFDKEIKSVSRNLDSTTGEHINMSTFSVVPKDVLRANVYNLNDNNDNDIAKGLNIYNKPFFYVHKKAIYKGTSNTEREKVIDFDNGLVNGSVQLLSTPYDVANKDSYMLIAIRSDNPIFPHVELRDGSPVIRYLLIARLQSGAENLELIGSYKYDEIINQFETISSIGKANLKFFTSFTVCCKGLLVSENGGMVDMRNGGLIDLKNDSNFFQGSLLIGADKNGFSFYEKSSNRIGYLAINRA